MKSSSQSIIVTIVIPVHNEAQNLQPLYAELRDVLDKMVNGVEVIFVDDGSCDGTWQEIGNILRQDARLYATRIRRRKGKAHALATGFRLALGQYVVTLDGDLQDDPKEIPKLLHLTQQGFDLVCGWKQERFDSLFVVNGSRIFNRVIGLVYGLRLHDHNCGLKCYRAEAVKEMRLFGELHRFITVIAHCEGFRVTEIPVHHRPRRHGSSKYGPLKFVEGILDLFAVRIVTTFLEKPFHLLGTVGITLTGIGFLGLTYLALYWVFGLGSIGGRPLLIYSTVAVLFGMQLIALGITAELINWKLSKLQNHAVQKFSGKDWEEAFGGVAFEKGNVSVNSNNENLECKPVTHPI